MAIDDDTRLRASEGDPNMPWSVERHLIMAAAMLAEREGLPPQTKERLVQAAMAAETTIEAIIIRGARTG